MLFSIGVAIGIATESSRRLQDELPIHRVSAAAEASTPALLQLHLAVRGAMAFLRPWPMPMKWMRWNNSMKLRGMTLLVTILGAIFQT